MIDIFYPLVIGSLTKVTAAWFPYKERFYATSFVILGGIAGYAIGDTSVGIFGLENPTNYGIYISVILRNAIVLLEFMFSTQPEEYPSMSQAKKHNV